MMECDSLEMDVIESNEHYIIINYHLCSWSHNWIHIK